MIGNEWVGVRGRQWVALSLGLLICLTPRTILAADCPGHPDALGTSRILAVDPKAHPRLGTMQYAETLPLRDHEVVLTFDDGPLPRNSNQVLDILAAQCVKATFFTIGRMAQAYPEGVRKLREAGHTIGTHTEDHPLTMNRMSLERAQQEIDDGIAAVTAALGGDAPAPFFRIPGLLRADGVENYLASRDIQVWSADFLADDWRHISASRVYELAMKRLEQKGRGILLLHDIQARTVAALPRILQELKARGFSVVQVVPATAERPATPTEPLQWQLYPPSETVAISHWPKIPNFVFADAGALAAPSLSDLDWHDERSMTMAELLDHAGRGVRGVPLPRQAPWPRQWPLSSDSTAIALPIPAESLFEIPERSFAAIAMASHPGEQTGQADREPDRIAKLIAADSSESRQTSRRRHVRHARRFGKPHLTGHSSRLAAHVGRHAPKRLVQAKRGSA
jgi:peptidoglycan/xylan/chitin deacetylase (PgdA/CDA1 family)